MATKEEVDAAEKISEEFEALGLLKTVYIGVDPWGFPAPARSITDKGRAALAADEIAYQRLVGELGPEHAREKAWELALEDVTTTKAKAEVAVKDEKATRRDGHPAPAHGLMGKGRARLAALRERAARKHWWSRHRPQARVAANELEDARDEARMQAVYAEKDAACERALQRKH